ncbi:hypothetical protein AGMMS50239_28330 [Bacteroidia bacterium]|nr:hypothetical protein AGMMS50239_28330 [Bacteroidia bacterium]
MEANKYKRLPYGNSNFERLIEENYAYVDKTHFIEMLEKENNTYLFFTRPRKFGKSLFFSMLSHYYDINRAGKFEQLFGDLYIGKHPTPKHNSMVVLNLDFSGLDTTSEQGFQLSFTGNIRQSVLICLERHKDCIPNIREFFQECKGQESIAEMLNIAFRAAESIGCKVFVIIDEYDHFANDLIALGTSSGDNVYRKIIRANGLVRDFYETLKTGSKTFIDRIMLTGIMPIMLDDLTSGFNISNNLSLKSQYNEMLGFTKEEVEWLMEMGGVDKSLIDIDIDFYYNGYLFHEKGKHRVYNPSMMLYYFDMVTTTEGGTKYIIDDNLKTDYGRLRTLIANGTNSEQLLEITENNRILSTVHPKFSIDELHNSENFTSLMYYLGLLTIEKAEYEHVWLKIPNYSIRTIYWEYILKLSRDRSKDIMIDNARQMRGMSDLALKGDPKPFLDYMSENFISKLSNRDLENCDEKYLKVLLLYSLNQSRLFTPISEMEISTGYADIYLKRSHLYPDIPWEWIWEIKYVKKSNVKSIEAKRDEAHAQLEKYRNSHLFAGRPDVRYLSVIFIGKDKYEIIEN